MFGSHLTRLITAAVLSVGLTGGLAISPAAVHAHDPSGVSEASLALSSLPVASVAMVASGASAVGASILTIPAVVLSATAELLVVSAQASAKGTIWILERASDGVRMTARFVTDSARVATVASGQVIVVTAVATGWVLSVARDAIAFVPRGDAPSLFHNERLP